MIENKKLTGSYYTPIYLAEFVVKKVLDHFQLNQHISLLEPSSGDGAFVKTIDSINNTLHIDLTAIEINEDELAKTTSNWNSANAKFINQDFLSFQSEAKFSAVIGNPPYVKKNWLSSEQIELARVIHLREELSEISVKNIWATFLVKSSALLNENGVLAFVLPSELLQVKFAEEIRSYLQRAFERIEVFTFDDLMFECKGQDTIVLFAYKQSNETGVFYANIVDKQQLRDGTFNLKKNNLLTDSDLKWTHHFLSSDDIKFINELKGRFETINHYCVSKPGIVTAANDFFIVNRETEEKYNLGDYTRPVIQKGVFVNGSVVFDKEDYQKLVNTGKPSKFLHLTNDSIISEDLQNYLEIGETKEIPSRYKCLQRQNWYVVPNVAEVPDGFFFKRCHQYPKLLKNETNALVTDAGYKIEMKMSYDINSFIYSFYNSFTLLFAEIEGRYYGGGVLELTPSEFKKLPVPYITISSETFNEFRLLFENKDSIQDVLRFNDDRILKTFYGLSDEDIVRVQTILKRLLSKRMRN